VQLRDTIVALATPPGRSGLGLVRISGDSATTITAKAFRLPKTFSWRPRHATLASIRDADGETVDQVMLTYFAGPHSYTAENVVEIACHGSPVVLAFCVDALIQAGARPAEPGEFTLRAFTNGRIDLPRAEAVRDLIDSTTIYQAKIAAQQVDGSLARRLRPIKEQLLGLISMLEAGIDFAEDATSEIDIPGDDQILPVLTNCESAIRSLVDSYALGRYVHEGLQLAIVGRPNVGKSSLFNALLRQERAIVADLPGTTRDLVSEHAAIAGIPVRLMDTAGIRDSGDVVENLGIERSYTAIADADLTLLVLDLSDELQPDDLRLLDRVRESGDFLVVGNKCDLPRKAALPIPVLAVSAKLNEGIDALHDTIAARIRPEDRSALSGSIITNARHAGLLRQCADSLHQGIGAQQQKLPHEMLLLDLYGALRYLDELTGATTADDILNRIFSTFCIGK
jgi:tRNA modification GTPase